MSRFRKKPVVIEAVQWFEHGDHPEVMKAKEAIDPISWPSFGNPQKDGGGNLCNNCAQTLEWHGWVSTLEGGHFVCPRDWIIRGVKGELYPCKPDIFDATYEPVEN